MGNRLISQTKTSQLRCILLLIMILIIYILQNYTPAVIKDRAWFSYLSKPILWLLIIGIISQLPRVKINGRVRLSILMKWTTAFCAILYIIVMVLEGMLGAFAKSPYDHSVIGIISNIIFVFVPIIGREMVRSYLINGYKYKSFYFVIGLISILFTLIELPVASINNLKTKLDIITYFGEVIFPRLCNNFLASYLVYRGGASLSLVYVIIQQGFAWFSPALPNPFWSIKVLIEILYPIFSLMFVNYLYISKADKNGIRNIKDQNPIGWAVTTMLSILIIWFAAGVFPAQPFVIATGSMEPVIYPGDVVIVNKTNIDRVRVGDIVQYQYENIFIFHRIIEIVEDNGEKKYRTKGDNNSAVDPELVRLDNIKGTVAYTIPKIGWPTLLLKMEKNVDRSEVEF